MSNNNNWLLGKMNKVDLPLETGLQVNENINKNNQVMINRNPNNNIQNTTSKDIQNQENGMSYYDDYQGPYIGPSLTFNSMEDKYNIKKDIQQKLNEATKKEKNKENLDDNYLKSLIFKFLCDYSIPEGLKKEIVQEILWDLKGYGILQPLLDDEQITEIMCCSFDNIWVEKKGKLQKLDLQFANEKELKNLIDKIVQPLGRRIDDLNPYVNARLKDKSRVNAVIDPISADGATLDIRKFAKQVFTMQDYIDKGSMSFKMSEFIKYITILRKNIIVSGGTGSGKTTLLNAMSRFIPESEAIVTIEDLLELQLIQPCVRRLEARGCNAEGKGAITIRDLVINALRMRPDRLIIGECRSGEVVDMLQAMNTGHDGSVTSVHSNNPRECIERLATMYQFAGLDIPDKAIKSQISSAVHVIIQAERREDGSRKITQISEVLGVGKRGAEKNNLHIKELNLDPSFIIKGVDNSEVYIQDIFRYDEFEDEFITTGWVPTFFKHLKKIKCPLKESDFK